MGISIITTMISLSIKHKYLILETIFSGRRSQISWDNHKYDKPALNAWLLSLSITKNRGLLVNGIKSPG